MTWQVCSNVDRDFILTFRREASFFHDSLNPEDLWKVRSNSSGNLTVDVLEKRKLRQRTITNIRHSQRGCFWSLAYPHIFQTANKKVLPQRSPTISSWQIFWQDFHETSARLTRQTSDLSVITLSERHVRSGVCFVCARGVKCAREPVSCTTASQDFTNDVDWDFWGERGKRCQLRVKARHP